MTKKILITGGSGMIGTRLTELLLDAGRTVAHLGRSSHRSSVPSFLWDIQKKKIDPDGLRGTEAIVHLAGANLGAKRWTSRRKKVIIQSRIESTRLLYNALRSESHDVKTLVSASAVGFYGSDDGQHVFTENDNQGEGFLADVVGKWEEAVNEIATLGIRVVKLRAGAALSDRGGALKEMELPVKLYVGSPLGTGNQIMSWIHIDDLCRIFIKAVDDKDMHGVYNAVTPNPVSNREMMHAIARALKRPILLPHVPAFVIRILFGEMSEVVLEGANVSSDKIRDAGFIFNFVKIEDALRDLLGKQA